MLIFVYGEDGFRVAEKVKTMRKAFAEKFDPTGLNTVEFPSEGRSKIDVGEVMNAVRSMPFLGKKRMVIIRGLVEATKKPEAKVWIEGFVGAPESTIVMFWEGCEPKVMEKKPLFEALKGGSEVHTYPFPMLEGVALNRWVQARVTERGGTIEPAALHALVSRVGADLWQMDNEIGKLAAYASGQTITSAMVDELVHASFEGKIFQLMDAVSQRRPADAIRLLQEERWSGANDHSLLAMLGRQVRILLGARALLDENPRAGKDELAKVLGLPSFVAQKALAQARGFSLEHLKAVHDLLFDYDVAMKTSRMDADLAVDLTTVALAQK